MRYGRSRTISVQNASGQTVTVPSHFSNIAEAAKNFIRRMCDAEMQRIETQRAVEQAQQKILSDTVHSAGNAISAFIRLGTLMPITGTIITITQRMSEISSTVESTILHMG